MLNIQKGLLVLAFVFFSPFVLAKELNVRVELKWLEPIKTSEPSGDELYIDVLTQNPQKNREALKRIPDAPTHWLSRYANQLQHVVLWQAPLEDDTEEKISIQLIEEDYSPFSPDQNLGVIDLVLQNKQGKLFVSFQKPDVLPLKEVAHYQEVLEKLDLPHSSYRVMLAIENLKKESHYSRRG